MFPIAASHAFPSTSAPSTVTRSHGGRYAANVRSTASTYNGVPVANRTPFAHRFASESNPMFATVVNHASPPSPDVARPKSHGATRPCSNRFSASSGRRAPIPRCRAKSFPAPVGTTAIVPSPVAAIPATSETVPSPPHTSTPSPRSNAADAARRVPSTPSGTSTRIPRTDNAPSSSTRNRRVRPRPATGFTIAVQRIAGAYAPPHTCER